MSRDNINHTFHRAVIFIFWLRSCVCTSSELHGWVPAGWFWDIQGRGKKSYDQEAGKTIKAVWSHENWIVHSTNIKMIVYCPYNWARSAAAVPVWVDHLQAVFGCSPGRPLSQQSPQWPAQRCFLCCYGYCFSWALWPTVLVPWSGFFLRSQIICSGSVSFGRCNCKGKSNPCFSTW